MRSRNIFVDCRRTVCNKIFKTKESIQNVKGISIRYHSSDQKNPRPLYKLNNTKVPDREKVITDNLIRLSNDTLLHNFEHTIRVYSNQAITIFVRGVNAYK